YFKVKSQSVKSFFSLPFPAGCSRSVASRLLNWIPYSVSTVFFSVNPESVGDPGRSALSELRILDASRKTSTLFSSSRHFALLSRARSFICAGMNVHSSPLSDAIRGALV
ncbi:hypothetical protein, partial [Marichromatium sp. AB31]|uniref:hypothetical protein n=1 Tax=Marichromatium sp. AB31 TaxID=2483362 RepID=UPI001CC1F1D4